MAARSRSIRHEIAWLGLRREVSALEDLIRRSEDTLNPDDRSYAYSILGRARASTGDLERALEAHRIAEGLAPTRSGAKMMTARTLWKDGNDARAALEKLDEAVRLATASPSELHDYRLHQAEILASIGEVDAAELHLQLALDAAEQCPGALLLPRVDEIEGMVRSGYRGKNGYRYLRWAASLVENMPVDVPRRVGHALLSRLYTLMVAYEREGSRPPV